MTILRALVLGAGLTRIAMSAEGTIDYNRDIRPLLSDRCYACHGPDEDHRKAGLRFDVRESVLGEADSGGRAIVPGDVRASELIRRIQSEDSELRMPPPDSNRILTPDEIEKLRRWIEQGADWLEHWAFKAPEQPELPRVRNRTWPRTPVDYFILDRLEEAGLEPSMEASKEALIRRVSFDLTGLPPTLEEIDAFLARESTQAYEELVDRLLQSRRFGEHMARYWLDIVRFGDSLGRHMDPMWDIWPYRDWVIRSFNLNKPWDEFIIEQLAGDLLANPTSDQFIATGFNRLHVTYVRGSVLPEEAYVRNVVDRVVTTGTVFMGLTFECSRCHDHKYDPLQMKDFYSLSAYFNSIDGKPMFQTTSAIPEPTLRYVKPESEPHFAALCARASEIETRKSTIETATTKRPEYAEWLAEEKGRKHDKNLLAAWIAGHVPEIQQLDEELAKIRREQEEISCTTAIWKERAQPRDAYILIRGEYQQQGEIVPRATPASLPPLPDTSPNNRLGLAQWLVNREHPLTARVAVNRFWQQVFGTGIVKTSEDFGSQGETPSHPRLLDWLSVRFREDGWNVKQLIRRMVLSSTYRQSSRITSESFRRDPENRLLGRGPRYRLDAEMLRDQALYISALLVEQLGGPSVKPPQPDGLWLAVSAGMSEGTQRFEKDVGFDKVHRRTLYTFIKRTAPPPQLAMLDAPSREYACVRRERTNTPLQALLLLNDPQYFEAARALAERVLYDEPSPRQAAVRMFRAATGRRAGEKELAELLDLYQTSLAYFEKHGNEAEKLIRVGERAPTARLRPAELAAWTTVGNLVLNLDETLTR